MKMTLTETQGKSPNQGDDEDDELLTPRVKKPKNEKGLDNVFTPEYHRKSPEDDTLTPRRQDTAQRNHSQSTDSSELSSSVPNIFSVSSGTSLTSLITNPVETTYAFDAFNPYNLTKQYQNASNALQSFSSKTSSYFDGNAGKYMENNNNNNNTSSSSEFNPVLGARNVTSSNYSFGPPNMLQAGFAPPNNIIGTKSSFSQFSPNYLQPSTTNYQSTNTGASAFNAPCFNAKFGGSDALNSNYLYPPNLFNATTKLPPYTASHSSTQIYPPPFLNNGIFAAGAVNSSLMSHTVQEAGTPPTYHQPGLQYTAGSNATLSTTDSLTAPNPLGTPTSPFSPTIPLMGVSTTHQSLDSSTSTTFDSRMPFTNESSYTGGGPYMELEQGLVYQATATADKFSRTTRTTNKQKVISPVKKPIKSKKQSTTDPDHGFERVFIWDLDETIVIVHSMITGEFASKFGKDPSVTLNLGIRLREFIYDVASTQLFFNDLEECDQVHIDDISTDDNGQDLSEYDFNSDGFCNGTTASTIVPFTSGTRRVVDWNRKLAFRYRKIKELYTSFRSNFDELFGTSKRDQWLSLRMDLESISDSWHTLAVKSLNVINRRPNTLNVVVTTSHLVPTLATCMLFGLSSLFPIENIYSATKDGKESCFQRIQARFGRKCTYVAIGDGRSDELPSKQLGIPFWRVTNHGDLVNLQHALELGHL